MITVVVTGSRDYAEYKVVEQTLDRLHGAHVITLLVHGGATGADTLAAQWAKARKVPCKAEPVTKREWDELGRKAGPLRNGRMLTKYKPDVVVVFEPGPSGTLDCVKQARKLGIYCMGPGLAAVLERLKGGK